MLMLGSSPKGFPLRYKTIGHRTITISFFLGFYKKTVLTHDIGKEKL